MIRFWWVLPCLALVLQACGFHLRGTVSLSERMSNIQLISTGIGSDRQFRLRQRLMDAGARIRTDDHDHSVRLSVSIKTLPERVLADSAGSGQHIVRLSRELTYSVIAADGNRLVDNKTLIASQDIELDKNNLLVGEDERQTAVDIVEDSLFNQLLVQLQRL